MEMMSWRCSINFMKRDGMVCGCIFILLHSHGASWTRHSKNSCQNNDNPHYHIYQHASLHRLYIVSAFHIQNRSKVRTYFSCLLAFRTVTTSASVSHYSRLYTEHEGEFNATVNRFCYKFDVILTVHRR